MKEIVILTEEPSIEPVFEHITQQIKLRGAEIIIIPHDGASSLEKSLPHKLRAWRNPDARFLIVRDNDSSDCVARKQRLQNIVEQTGREEQSLIRIVCQELEAWFLGDRHALDAAGILSANFNKETIRGDVDQIHNPSKVLDKITGGYAKRLGAQSVAPHLRVENNTSQSFKNTISALQRLACL